jgi:hypothetical protein
MAITARQGRKMRALIQEQAEAANAATSCEMVAGALLTAARLREHFSLLTDRQVGQPTLGLVWSRLVALSPEATVAEEAIKRLFLSAASAPADVSPAEAFPPSSTSTRCDPPMVLQVGIGEPDYLLCEAGTCRYAQAAQENRSFTLAKSRERR